MGFAQLPPAGVPGFVLRCSCGYLLHKVEAFCLLEWCPCWQPHVTAVRHGGDFFVTICTVAVGAGERAVDVHG